MKGASTTRFQQRPRPRDLPDPQTHGAIRELRNSVDEIRKVEHLDGRLLVRSDPNDKAATSITLTVGVVNKIAHGLGRPMKGWRAEDIITGGATAAGLIDRLTIDGTDRVDEGREIWLKPIGFTGVTTIKVRLWVY